LLEGAVTAVDVERQQVWSGQVVHQLRVDGVKVARMDDGALLISHYVAGRVVGMEVRRSDPS
jgi:hypothetical protein